MTSPEDISAFKSTPGNTRFLCPQAGSAVEMNAYFTKLNDLSLPGIWNGNGEKILLLPVQPRSSCLLQLRQKFWFASFRVPTGFLTRVHTWLHTNRPNLLIQHLADCVRDWASIPLCDALWINEGIFLTCKSGLRQSFQLTPSETWVGSRNTSLNLTWPDLEDFCVITALGRVDSHARREVEEGGCPGAVMRADVRQQRAVPGAEER